MDLANGILPSKQMSLLMSPSHIQITNITNIIVNTLCAFVSYAFEVLCSTHVADFAVVDGFWRDGFDEAFGCGAKYCGIV